MSDVLVFPVEIDSYTTFGPLNLECVHPYSPNGEDSLPHAASIIIQMLFEICKLTTLCTINSNVQPVIYLFLFHSGAQTLLKH